MNDVRPEAFFTLVQRLSQELVGQEVLLGSLAGEVSDFVRLNHNRVRQAGTVRQYTLQLDLIEGQRHACGECDLSGDDKADALRLARLLGLLREQRAQLPEDPHLLYATEAHEIVRQPAHEVIASEQALEQLIRSAGDLDLVGIWASGTIVHGFASSLGHCDWHETASFNLDWSCYLAADKAVKLGYAGQSWDPQVLERKLDAAREQIEVLARPARTLTPGGYRTYLAPRALEEILGMMSWGGFGLKSHRTAQTPLLKMVRDGWNLHPSFTLIENHAGGLTPPFTDRGFRKPAAVTLIENGRYRDCLVSPRSAREYGAEVNCAGEIPESLDLAGGDIAPDEILAALDTGIYVNALWYCNFSDRNHCRITGMTRFACFWVENGAIVAPIGVMRFDDSVYRMLGSELQGFTRERELLVDPGTYQQRTTASARLPGALIGDFRLTL